MNLGVIKSYNSGSASGKIHSSNDGEVDFSYQHGQTIVYGQDMTVPEFSGKHIQPKGYRLKLPRPGDAVVYGIFDGQIIWGYAAHVLSALERQHGTEFR